MGWSKAAGGPSRAAGGMGPGASARAGGDRALSGMRAGGVDALVEGGWGAEQGGESHGAGDVGEAGEAGGAPEGEGAHGGKRLGSIEQREAFLGVQAEGFDGGEVWQPGAFLAHNDRMSAGAA